MRYFILKIFLFSSFLFVSSCKNTGTTEQGNYFYTVIDKYFGEYDPREKVWINKPVNKYAIAEVEKSKLSLNDFEIIQRRLKNDGWKLISSHDGFFEYCLDKKYIWEFFILSKKNIMVMMVRKLDMKT